MKADFASLLRAANAASDTVALASIKDSPEAVLEDLIACGFTVELEGEDRLWVKPANRLTENQKRRISAMKAGILTLLAPKTLEPPAGWNQPKADAALAAALARVDALELLAPGLQLWDCERQVLRRFYRTFNLFLFESECVHDLIRRNILEMRAT